MGGSFSQVYMNFHRSSAFTRMVRMVSSDKLTYVVQPLVGHDGVTERTWRFANGAAFGVRQYMGIFPEEALSKLEEHVNGLRPEDYQVKMPRMVDQ
jgi:hypothetical protein